MDRSMRSPWWCLQLPSPFWSLVRPEETMRASCRMVPAATSQIPETVSGSYPVRRSRRRANTVVTSISEPSASTTSQRPSSSTSEGTVGSSSRPGSTGAIPSARRT